MTSASSRVQARRPARWRQRRQQPPRKRRGGDLGLLEAAQERDQRTFVGRETELAALFRVLEEGGPLVIFVHGVAGIGKSALLNAFAREARARDTTVLRIDCAAIEPTDRGFLGALRVAVAPRANDPLEAIASAGRLVLLLADTYEAFRVSDAWFRHGFLAGLPPNARVVVAGRDAPSLQWFGPLGWTGGFTVLELGPLNDGASTELLRRSGVPSDQAHRLNRVARGHPLALRVAAVTAFTGAAPVTEADVAHRVIGELAQRYLEQLDPRTRTAIDAASVVRRATVSLLGSMLDNAAPQDAFERLAGLPFVRSTPDGLAIHETLQHAIATRLRADDPKRHRRLRQAAWRHLSSEIRGAAAPDLWRYTADMIFLIENPIVHEAFFPAGGQLHSVEAARPADSAAVLETITRHDGPKAAALEHAWWERAPQTFRVVRDRDGAIAGFYQVFDPRDIPDRVWPDDPIALAWREHARRELRRGERALISRRVLDRANGEAAGAVQAATWLDLKRLYMEMRPHLRRLYATARSILDFMPALEPLFFAALPELTVKLDGHAYPTVMLDFGPGSVDEWLARVAARELGIPQYELLDLEAREIVVDDARVPLTNLEFALLRYLMQRDGDAVPRADLLQDVWGYSYVGDSNVVEVAVRSLRRKLGDRSHSIETVRGVGYRYRRMK